MSYREIHELFVVCDECHTSLSVYDATYEPPTTRPPTTAGNATSSKAGTTARSTGTSNAMTATSPTVERRTNWKPMGGTSTEIIHATASVRTTAISHAANAASGMSDRCTGSNTRDGR